MAENRHTFPGSKPARCSVLSPSGGQDPQPVRGAAMPRFTYEHIHLRSPNPEATAKYYETTFVAEVLRTMQQGKPRIDLKLGGPNIFIAPVASDSGVNPPPVTPYQGLDHFGLSVSGIDEIVAELKAQGAVFA